MIHKADEGLYLQHYHQAEEISGREGIHLNERIICEIEWRIWRHQFVNEPNCERKKEIFENNLSQIIAEFGTYKVFEQIVDRLKEFQE